MTGLYTASQNFCTCLGDEFIYKLFYPLRLRPFNRRAFRFADPIFRRPFLGLFL